ncbi:tRNA (guanine(37)-N1)-methyltransferase [Diachasma alloeum]|uniref:tRNA (guanine(37)-N1)-methyltransferase n=1 Tax=Diachasma alloeum TaxID=454923 RepID=UPI00073845B9|nr:tRNA (guanine(37)-N1)-methyltransferase [Diachasma alloeum]
MIWKISSVLISFLRHYRSPKIKNMVYSLSPPSSVKGMISLNRDKFTCVVQVPSLELKNISYSEIMPVVKKYLLKMRHWKSVQQIEDRLVIYLNPEMVEKMEDLEENDRTILSKHTDVIEKRQITINYENWTADTILGAIIPEDIGVPSSFTKVGHIVHLNLRENQLPFKKLIGEVYLDFVAQTKVVVNKVNNIDTEFRNFSMETLAGDGDTITTVKENNCKFTFDFAKVYWNSRLATEHGRLLEYMVKDDVLYDVFAGVGPFAVPAARKGLTVLANDLNPESYKWLRVNATDNKVKKLSSFNKDGRDFLREDVKQHLLNRRYNDSPGCEHIAMNLPALAVEFLHVFRDWMDNEETKLMLKNPPLIHLYCFVKASKTDDVKQLAKQLIEQHINTQLLPPSVKTIQYVRNVAPNKEMMRVSFYLTQEIMTCQKLEEPAIKRPRIDHVLEIVGENGEKQGGKSNKDEQCI